MKFSFEYYRNNTFIWPLIGCVVFGLISVFILISLIKDKKECFDKYGVDAIMIGRGSIGQPWIFEEIKHYLYNNSKLERKNFKFYLEILKEQVENNIERADEIRGILHSRRHIAATPLFKGIDHFKQTKIKILRADTKKELFELMDNIEKEYNINF